MGKDTKSKLDKYSGGLGVGGSNPLAPTEENEIEGTGTPRIGTLNLVLDEISAERIRQDAKWGEQNHPSVATLKSGPDRCNYYGVLSETEAKATCEHATYRGTLTWGEIAIEEMSEVVSAPDDVQRRAELVQLAAVCVAWIECIDRSAGK